MKQHAIAAEDHHRAAAAVIDLVGAAGQHRDDLGRDAGAGAGAVADQAVIACVAAGGGDAGHVDRFGHTSRRIGKGAAAGQQQVVALDDAAAAQCDQVGQGAVIDLVFTGCDHDQFLGRDAGVAERGRVRRVVGGILARHLNAHNENGFIGRNILVGEIGARRSRDDLGAGAAGVGDADEGARGRAAGQAGFQAEREHIASDTVV